MSPTPYTKQTWQDDNVSFPVSANRLTVIENGINDAHYRPCVSAVTSATVAIPASSWTPVPMGTERFDTDAMHSTSVNTNRLNFSTPGIYSVMGGVVFTPTAVDVVQLARLIAVQSGVTTTAALSGGYKNSTVGSGQSPTALLQVVNGDFCDLQVWSSATTALSASGSAGWAFLNAHVASF